MAIKDGVCFSLPWPFWARSYSSRNSWISSRYWHWQTLDACDCSRQNDRKSYSTNKYENFVIDLRLTFATFSWLFSTSLCWLDLSLQIFNPRSNHFVVHTLQDASMAILGVYDPSSISYAMNIDRFSGCPHNSQEIEEGKRERGNEGKRERGKEGTREREKKGKRERGSRNEGKQRKKRIRMVTSQWGKHAC